MTEQEYRTFFSSLANANNLINNILVPILGNFSSDPAATTNYATKPKYFHLAQPAKINSINHLGDFSVGVDIDGVAVFDVLLEDSSNITRSRKQIQGIVRQLIRDVKVGAFIVFHYRSNSARIDKETWRLSWVEKTGSVASTTSAKRYTYLCGPSYSCRTLAERFVVLEKKAKDSTFDISDITAAFDVEALSKDFFKEYKIFYDDIIQWITGTRFVGEKKAERKSKLTKSTTDLYKPFADKCAEVYAKDWSTWTLDEQTEKIEKFIRDWVKKLLGRLVFLQFIQKKGWLGIDESNADWDCGNENFLLDRFNACSLARNNFLKDELYAILFNSLNQSTCLDGSGVKITKRTGIKYPFLNGGLFEEEPADQLHIELPNEFFHNDNHSKARSISNKGYREKEADFFAECGVLDFFSHYNFTIDENASDEDEMGEVGIDPEMLSKVFENLLEDNKEKGAFYTPKEIVNYMCKESLIAYLNTKISGLDADIRVFVENISLSKDIENKKSDIITALRNVKICDPAVGSGAFPMGLLNLILKLRLALNDDSCCGTGDKGYNYANIISTIKDADENENIEAINKKEQLARIKCAIKKSIIQNNIYGVDIEKGAVDLARLRFWLNIVVDEEKPTPLPNLDFKIMQGNSLLEQYAGIDLSKVATMKIRKKCEVKCDLFGDIDGVEKDVLYVPDEYVSFNLQEELNKYFDISALEEKKDARERIEKYLHCIICSTLQVQVVEKQQALTRLGQITTLNQKQQKGKAELERGIEELGSYIENLDAIINDQFFLWHTWFADVFAQGGFDIVIGNPPYVNFANIKPTKVRELYKHLFTTIKNKCDLYNIFTEQAYLLLKDFGNCSFIFSNSWMGADSFSLFRKFLVEKTNVHKLVDLPLYVFPAKVKTNIIVFAKEQINAKNIILVESDGKIFKNLGHSLAYSTIKQYVHYPFSFDKPQNSSIILTKKPNKLLGSIADFTLGIKTSDNNRFIKNQPFSSDSYELIKGENVDIRYNCPTSSKWIWYRPDLMKQKKGAGPRKLEYFTVDSKIVVQDVNVDIFATIDNNKYLCDDTLNVIYQCDNDYSLEYLLAILNAKAVRFWRKITYPKGLHVKKYQLEAIPIPTIVLQQKPIISIVDRILHAKKSNPQADTSMEESMIDILVYLLYGLTYEEIMTIEESFCKPAENDGESNTKKRKKKSVSSTFKKLKIEEDKYTHWLSKYQKDGTLPREAEMREAIRK